MMILIVLTLHCLSKVGRTFSYPNGRRPDSGSKALADLSFQVKQKPDFALHSISITIIEQIGFDYLFYLQIGDYLDVAILTQ